ncbi:hypothetical protein ACFOOK_07570 [Micromonospora krabiensis]|uniref:Uncharacterized protein n=1 Tax=Micromonospora krabiensis TaxID=307121 RepID=A0A1C3NC43_9ACTN|nr:hypothetical protein [Micromonospora krabiensis]SBV30143.1 hypothetical protein GA0070620_5736 [Micromonospora krabiensis]
MNKLVATTTKFQHNATNSTDETPIAALMIITPIPIAALVWIALAGNATDSTTTLAAISAVAAIGGSAVGGIVYTLRKRPGRGRR